jgi:transposase
MGKCRQCVKLLGELERWERRHSHDVHEIYELKQRVRRLEELLAARNKTSATSSKPPSSDIVKPAKKPAPGPRGRGGAVGHAPQQRPPFQANQIDAVQQHAYEACPKCGGPVELLPTPAEVVQQVELVAKPTLVTEHQSRTCRCAACKKDFVRPLPPNIAKTGLFGPRLTAFVAYLKGACHASYGTIQNLLRETCGLSIATGTLAKLCQKVSRSLAPAYDDLLQQIPQQTALHIDETGHCENGKRCWTWVFRAPQFTLFQITESRSGDILDRVLGEAFSGTLLSDYYSVYRSYLAAHPLAHAQFCLAHFVRDAKYLQTLPAEEDRKFGAELLAELDGLFQVWHGRGKFADDATFRATLVAQGEKLVRVATEQAPDTSESWALAKRFREHASQYLRFTHTPGIEPTNNAAEQAIRYVVIDRRVTQGTRSERGRNWCQRIWTTIATCRQQGQDLLSFLKRSYLALLTDTPPPLLLPAPSTG